MSSELYENSRVGCSDFDQIFEICFSSDSFVLAKEHFKKGLVFFSGVFFLSSSSFCVKKFEKWALLRGQFFLLLDKLRRSYWVYIYKKNRVLYADVKTHALKKVIKKNKF